MCIIDYNFSYCCTIFKFILKCLCIKYFLSFNNNPVHEIDIISLYSVQISFI